MAADDSRLFVALRDELQEEMGLHRELLRLAEDKHRRIVDGQIDVFTRLLEEERGCMERARALRDRRERLLVELARHTDQSLDGLRLAQLLERVEPPLRDELSALQTDLRAVLVRLREVNDRNLLLARQSLSFVRDVMDVVLGSERRQGYDRSGDEGREARSAGGLFDGQA